MTNREDMIRELEEARALVLSAIELLPDADFARLIGDAPWSPADILNHLTAWDEVAAITICQIVACEPLTHWQDDVDGFNHAAVQSRRELPQGDILSALHDARQSFRDAVNAVPADVWATQVERYLSGIPKTIPGILRVWTDHDAEHAAELRAFRDRAAGSGPQSP